MSSISPTDSAPTLHEDTTAAIVSYIGGLGLVAAIFLHNNKKTALGAFHLRQALGLTLSYIVIVFGSVFLAFIPILGWLAIFVLFVGMLVLWIIGLVAAVKGEIKPVPMVGAVYQQWFKNAFN